MSQRPYITYAIIALTIIVHIHSTLISPTSRTIFIDEYALNPSYVSSGRRLVSLVSYALLHKGWTELIVNALSLLLIGTVLEEKVGYLRFAGVFAVSGLLAGITYAVTSAGSSIALMGYSPSVFGLIAVLFLLLQLDNSYLLNIQIPGALVGLLAFSIEAMAIYLVRGSSIPDTHLVGFSVGVVSAFVIDQKKAMKGLLIAIVVGIALFLLASYFGFFKAP